VSSAQARLRLDREQHEEGVSCEAPPVFDRSGLACGTISISGPTARIDKADAAALGDLLRRHAAEVSAAPATARRSRVSVPTR